jgi:hypoxanthine phosphoribosyltransferase
MTRAEIAVGVSRLAGEIDRDYRGKRPHLAVVLKGSFIFAADLVRELELPVSIEFVRAESYRGAESSREVSLAIDAADVKGRDVLVVEDIVDTGATARRLMDALGEAGPASLKLCALLDKPSRRLVELEADYVGFTIPDHFVVGYGLDFDQEWRHLPDLYRLD